MSVWTWIGLFCTLMAGLAYAFVSGVIVMPLSQTMFAVILGMMLGLYHESPPTSVAPARQIALLRLVTGAAAAGLLWSLVPDIMLRMETDIPIPTANVVTFGPRFWQEGGIPH